jgi:hypothetical protein
VRKRSDGIEVKDVVYGAVNGELIFIERARAHELVATQDALWSATTWGELKAVSLRVKPGSVAEFGRGLYDVATSWRGGSRAVDRDSRNCYFVAVAGADVGKVRVSRTRAGSACVLCLAAVGY